uniref:Uncharacterized protein n=1 Tax=Oryza brachyantha TaxID=4533 RepID=J3LA68_ORYBR
MSSGSAVTGGGSAGAAEDAAGAARALGQKLPVHVAENGHTFEFKCGGETPVEAIQRTIETLCGIPPADQLLLCGNTSLDGAHPLAYYKLPRDDREVFLYNKARLLADAPRPAPEAIDIPQPSIPPPPRPQDSPPLEVSADPALKALVSYETTFRYHFQVANAVYQSSVAKHEVCCRLLREGQVQERALDTARSNLEHTARKLTQRYTDFVKCFSQQHRGHTEMLANFEKDVQRLRTVRLHPALQCDGRRSLLDLIKENDLRKLADGCLSSHRQFDLKVSQLKENFMELKKRLDNLFNIMSSTGCKDLETMIKEHEKFIGDQKSIMQSLSKDVNTSKKLVDDCSNCQLSASLRPHDAVSAVGRIYEVHEKDNLPSVNNIDHMLTKLLEKCKAKKNEMNTLVHVSMQRVKSAQIGIKDMMNELHAFQEVLGHQDRDFDGLKLVSGLGHAYRACLAEVVRRKSSFKLYTGLAGQLAEKLATEREAEVRRREAFFRTWSKYIPEDIMGSMGLFDTPSQCDVTVAPFDCNLLPIDVDDVEKLAPQSLVGSLLKSERSQLPKSSLSHSGTSGSLSKSEQYPLNADDKMDFQDFLGGFDTVDIAGTSKLEVENARLKAELASAIAVLCSFGAEYGYESIDEGQIDNVLKETREKTAVALSAKDEYANHLKSMLTAKQNQNLSYEKRIQELEERLANQYIQGHMISGSKDASDSLLSAFKANDCNAHISGGRQNQVRDESSVAMDEASSTSEQPSKQTEGGDENMTDISGALNLQLLDSIACTNLDAFMAELPPDSEHKIVNSNKEGQILTQFTTTDASGVPIEDPLGILNSRTNEHTSELRNKELLVSELQTALESKSKRLDEIESKLNAVVDEVNSLKKELEHTQGLLDESQMNCVQLENYLHEAREEARTNKCSADRRAVEYDALRSSALRIHGLFERLNNCVTAPGMSGFADSLRALAHSLASVKKDEGDTTSQFQQCIKTLADKVGFLSRQSAELLERYSRIDAANRTYIRELEEKKESVKNLYSKLQLEKQASKEKISFGRFEVHELAVFVRNPAGHYEAINRNCSNYFLSEESVALFTEQHSRHPAYIIGQIVHIERRIAKLPSHGDQMEASRPDSGGRRSPTSMLNPYNLPVGCEYFLVTVAMIPDTIR